MKFIYCYCFILDCNEIMDCIDDNRNESKTDVQNGDCDYLKKMATPVFCGEFFLNIIKFSNIVLYYGCCMEIRFYLSTLDINTLYFILY